VNKLLLLSGILTLLLSASLPSASAQRKPKNGADPTLSIQGKDRKVLKKVEKKQAKKMKKSHKKN
jgi:hypothetical protein